MATPTLSNNAPLPAHIAWGDFVIKYEGESYAISAASTDQRWVWWKYNNGAPSIEAGATVPTDLTDDDLVLFANKNGVGIRIQATSLVDGELLVDGSIFAEALSTNLVNSEHIVTEGLDAAVVKFGAMSGDRIAVNTLMGDRVIANSLLVSALAVADWNNYITDPYFNLDRWTGVVGITIEQIANMPLAIGIGRVLRFDLGGTKTAFSSDFITVDPSQELRTSVWVRKITAAGGPTGSVKMEVRHYDIDGDNNAPFVLSTSLLTSAMVQNDWYELIIDPTTLPAGVSAIRLELSTDGVNAADDFEFAVPQVNKKQNGRLIVDGTIQGRHIESRSVTTEQLAADAITVEMLTGGDVLITGLLEVKETVSEAVSTAGLYVGDNISITELGGIVVRTPLGDTILPADGQAPVFTGSATFNALSVLGNLKIQGLTNEIAKGSTLRLATGTTAPKTSPAGSSYWPTKTAPTGYTPRGLAYHATTQKYYVVDSVFGASAGGLTENSGDFTNTLGYSISLNGTDSVGGSSWNKSEILGAFGGVAIIGNTIFFLCHTDETYPASYDSKWYVYRGTWNAATSKWDYVGRWLYEPSTFLGGYSQYKPTIGVRESTGQIVIAQCGDGNGSAWLTTFSTTGTQASRVAINTSTGAQWSPSRDFTSCGFTNGDFGSERFYLTTINEAKARTFTPSTMNNIVSEEFPLPTTSPIGFMYDSVKGIWRTRSSTAIYDHTSILNTTLAAVMTWRKADGVAPDFSVYETDKSAQWITTTFPKRSALQLSSGTIPDDITDPNDPDAVTFYVAQNDISGANAAFKRQTVPAAGVTTMKYTSLSTVGENPPLITTRPFPAGTPARIISDDGVLIDIRGSGQWRLGDISGDINGRVIGGAFVPIGGMVMFEGLPASVPTGWLICWGGTASEVTYPLLVPLLVAAGAAYTGTAPNRVVTLPDTRDRFPSGVGLGSVRTLHTVGGSDTVTMPDHTHKITQHDHGLGAGTTASNTTTGGSAVRMTGAGSTGQSANNIESGLVSGTNPAISNVPKYFGTQFIMRAS